MSENISPLFQSFFYVGNAFNGILYGVQLVLYFQTMQLLCKKHKRHRSDKFFMFFSTMLLFCITVFVATQDVLGQEAWVIHQGWPGGPAAYFLEYSSSWYQTWGTAACIFLQLMSDGLLIHRCWTVWGGNWKIVVFPSMLWLGTLAVGILMMFAGAVPNTNFYTGLAAVVGVAYFALTIFLNVLTTCTICVRIISCGLTMRRGIGEEFAATYFTVVSMVIESAIPYTLSGIVFIFAYGLQSETAVLFLTFYVMFTCISPQMLVFRVAEGKAWTRDTAGSQHLATVAFAETEPPTSEFHASLGAADIAAEGETQVHLHDADLSQLKQFPAEKLV